MGRLRTQHVLNVPALFPERVRLVECDGRRRRRGRRARRAASMQGGRAGSTLEGRVRRRPLSGREPFAGTRHGSVHAANVFDGRSGSFLATLVAILNRARRRRLGLGRCGNGRGKRGRPT